MLTVKIGDAVETCHGNKGVVIKKYFVAGKYETYVHIKEPSGQICYCPLACITKKGVSLDEKPKSNSRTRRNWLAKILRGKTNKEHSE